MHLCDQKSIDQTDQTGGRHGQQKGYRVRQTCFHKKVSLYDTGETGRTAYRKVKICSQNT